MLTAGNLEYGMPMDDDELDRIGESFTLRALLLF